jgi:UDP:flavonoid glycosyltransferase YjiC (YdhE family)
MKLLVHDSQKQLRRRSTDDVLIVSGFLPYTSILPQTSILITTGSYCIQHLALYYNVPMLFVPILTEQYFWAKNYRQQTGIPYIDNMTYSKNNVQCVSDTISLILSSKPLKKWLESQSKNIKKSDGSSEATKVLKKIIQKR